MNITEASSFQLEILVSTMNRNSLEFLEVMFQNNTLSEYQILIINQTTADCLLTSERPNVRVINSFERGLSKSRNLAMNHAIGDICLLADDDVIYLKGFETLVLQSHKRLKDADLITYKTLTTEDRPYYEYPKNESVLGRFCKYVLSIEISFKRKSIVESKVRFNENFGLGATFQDSENYIFLQDLMHQCNHKLMFVPEFIVIHEPFSSSSQVDSDRLIFARSALSYKRYGNAAYIYVAKLIYFLFRKNYIKFKDINHKINVAHSGIATYKKLKIE